jgi:penicillin amidase
VSLGHRLGPSRIDWTWGGLHLLRLRPFVGFDGASPPRPLPPPRSIGGDGTTPRVTRPRAFADFGVVEASAYTIAIDLAAPDRLLSSLLPGQVEQELHPHSIDGLERWAEGRPSVLLTSRLMIEEASSARLILDPSK